MYYVGQGFSNFFSSMLLNEMYRFQCTTNIFFCTEVKKYEIGKNGLTLRICNTMLLAMLHISKYMWLMFYLF